MLNYRWKSYAKLLVHICLWKFKTMAQVGLGSRSYLLCNPRQTPKLIQLESSNLVGGGVMRAVGIVRISFNLIGVALGLGGRTDEEIDVG